DAVIFELGAPAVHHDWSSLRTDPSDVSGNLARIKQLAWDQQRRRIGTALVRFGDWNMDPHQVGAGYHQQYNKIFITAGALRPPFFNPAADPAVNFGAVGHTIAHELGHALDDQGSQFDRHGALRDWWTAASREAYEQRTRALIRQYASYVPIEGTPLNAEQMIGEIVGDLTGTIIAYRAYQLYIDDHGEPPTLSGYTGNQRFFMATAQQYRMITTEEVLRNIALHSAHPPSEYRINGVLTNFDPWYADFSVTPNAAMFTPPATRVRLW
ncbi:MAG: M13 family metallopeptidase, partial [Planctomycetota bacterium]